ncbi:acyltransferase ChoActase/COT/CPT [Phycomyces blakesleeanus]|uniref:Acyltransferase ChoActase/COT/CPT n=1 Tax=Phycomyces blakesleeanus TaxID=4837 RepID=A0ABR3AWA9_PHYBL
MAPATYSFQDTLPRLPIPSLKNSCDLYLRTLVPLLTPQEYANTERIVTEFQTSELAQSLQQRLVDLDQKSPYNWLEDNFWLNKAYLEWREPVMVNSNWYILGQDDANHPKELLANNAKSVAPGEFTRFQIRRAAHMVLRGVHYKEIIDRQELPVEMMKGNKAQCMWQYSRIFGVTRVPLPHCDSVLQGDASKLRHIIVVVRDQLFNLEVYDQNGPKSVDALEKDLLNIVTYVQNLQQLDAAIPLLTSWDRDNWAVARNHLLTIDPSHRVNTQIIETSLFGLALDDYSHGDALSDRTRSMFCGNQGIGNGHNRWFDKSFLLIVDSSGKCGVSGEHSPADALTVSFTFDHMLMETCPGPFDPSVISKATTPATANLSAVNHLRWKSDAKLIQCLADAQIAADAVASKSDSDVLIFTEFGNDWVKKVGRVPPDAFYQMALQLAYFRTHNTVVPTYESGSTRKYLHGRTETIRSCSTDSKRFVEAFVNPSVDNKTKYELLQKAAVAHRDYTMIASDGYGCDRHLMALRILNADHQMLSKSGKFEDVPMHPIFKDPAYANSQTWLLSTSSLHAGVRLMGTGFGAVYPDGYGINYMPAPKLIKFGIESKRGAKSVSTKEFAENIRQALRDLRVLCEDVNVNPKARL